MNDAIIDLSILNLLEEELNHYLAVNNKKEIRKWIIDNTDDIAVKTGRGVSKLSDLPQTLRLKHIRSFINNEQVPIPTRMCKLLLSNYNQYLSTSGVSFTMLLRARFLSESPDEWKKKVLPWLQEIITKK